MKRTINGFTIVELLIVIVVIAILAAISVVAYTGVQQRATNAAIIDAASKSLRLVQSYIAANNAYPVTSGSSCVTTSSGCLGEGGSVVNSSTSLDNAMATIGTLPRSVPDANTNRKGVYFTYNPGLTFQGASRPLLMVYYLSGTAQSCGVGGVINYTWPDFTPSNLGYTSANAEGSGATRCWVSVPGPGV